MWARTSWWSARRSLNGIATFPEGSFIPLRMKGGFSMTKLLEKKRLARQWLEKAEGDLVSAEHLLKLSDSLCRFDVVCFHAQQCAEKSLKGFLFFRRIPFERIHDLGELLELCVGDPKLIQKLDKIDTLTPYAVETRYPGEWEPFDRRKAEEAVTLARRVFETIRTRLL